MTAQSYAALSTALEPVWQDLTPEQLQMALHKAARLPATARRGDSDEGAAFATVTAMLTARFQQLLPSLNQEQLAQALHTCARMRLLPGPRHVISQVLQQLAGVTNVLAQPRHAAELAWALAVLDMGAPHVMAELSQVVATSADTLSGAHLRQAAWAFASAKHYEWATFNAISRAATPRVAELDLTSLCCLMWAMAAAQHQDDLLCQAVAAAAIPKLASSPPYQVAQLVHALARLKYEHPPLYEAAAAVLSDPAATGALPPTHLANLAWAYASRRTPEPQLFAALGDRAVQVAPLLNSSQACALAVSYARHGVKHGELLAALGARTAALAAAGMVLPPHASGLARSFGALRARDDVMFKALVGFVLAAPTNGRGGAGGEDGGRGGSRLSEFNMKNLSDFAWGVSSVGFQEAGLFDAITAAALPQLADATPQSLSELCWAAANAGHLTPPLFEGAAQQAAARMSSFNLRQLADLLWACAVAGHRNQALLEAASQLLPQRLEQLRSDTESQAKLLWAMRQLSWRDAELEAHLSQVVPDVQRLLNTS